MTHFDLFTRDGLRAAPVAAPQGVTLAQLVAMRDRLELDTRFRVQLRLGDAAQVQQQACELLAA